MTWPCHAGPFPYHPPLPAAPPLSHLRIRTHCPNCHYPVPRDNQPPICPECGKPARRELTEDETRLLTPAERAFLKRWRPRYTTPPRLFVLAFLVGAVLVLALLTGGGLKTPVSAAIGVAIGALIARLIHRFSRARIRPEMHDAEEDLTDAHAAISYFDIQQSIIITGEMHAEPVAFAFLRINDHQALGFKLDTITSIFPDIAHHAPTRLAIDFLPHTGILLNARAASENTIPTEHREVGSIENAGSTFVYEIHDLDKSIQLTEGDPPLFPNHPKDETP